MDKIIDHQPLMDFCVTQTSEGYILKVTALQRTVNEWNLGLNEEVAQSKASTLVEMYRNGLEFLQDQVRETYMAKEQEAPASSQSTH